MGPVVNDIQHKLANVKHLTLIDAILIYDISYLVKDLPSEPLLHVTLLDSGMQGYYLELPQPVTCS